MLGFSILEIVLKFKNESAINVRKVIDVGHLDYDYFVVVLGWENSVGQYILILILGHDMQWTCGGCHKELQAGTASST